MKHRKPVLIFIVSMVIFFIFTIPIIHNSHIRDVIYYLIEYDIDLSNREEIIDKVETFNYSAYLNYSSYAILLDHDYKSYIDRDFIDFLKAKIDNYNESNPHNLHYSFLGENHSEVYLTYNDNTIFGLQDQNNQTLFSKRWRPTQRLYLNFTQIPFVGGNISRLKLNNLIYIEINVKYVLESHYGILDEYECEQYLLLDKNLDIVLIYVFYDLFLS
jgi:hypothetical protein